jgi:WD40 repeat protein
MDFQRIKTIIHPAKPKAIVLYHNVERKKTLLKVIDISGNSPKVVLEKEYDELLNNPNATETFWATTYMPERKWGYPAIIRFWNWETCELIKEFKKDFHKYGDTNFKIAPDNTTIALATFDSDIHFYDLNTEAELGKMPTDNFSVDGFSFNNTSNKFAFTSKGQMTGYTTYVAKENGEFIFKNKVGVGQILDDYYTSNDCTLFDEDDNLIVIASSGDNTIVKYIPETDTAIWESKFDLQSSKNYKTMSNLIDGFDDEDYYNLLLDLSYSGFLKKETIYIGGIQEIFCLDNKTGEIKDTLKTDLKGFIFNIHPILNGNKIFAIDHLGEFTIV